MTSWMTQQDMIFQHRLQNYNLNKFSKYDHINFMGGKLFVINANDDNFDFLFLALTKNAIKDFGQQFDVLNDAIRDIDIDDLPYINKKRNNKKQIMRRLSYAMYPFDDFKISEAKIAYFFEDEEFLNVQFILYHTSKLSDDTIEEIVDERIISTYASSIDVVQYKKTTMAS